MTTSTGSDCESGAGTLPRDTAVPLALFELERKRHLLWNTTWIRVYLGLWSISSGLVGTMTILPVFMARAGLSKVLIGMLPAIQGLGSTLPQPVSAYASAGLARKKRQLLWFHVPILLMSFALAVGSFFAYEGRRLYCAVLVLGTNGVLAFGNGLVNPPYFDLVAKLVPEGKRGGFFGLNWAIFSAAGVVGASIARYILDWWSFPTNFAVSFLAGAALYSLSTASLLPVREPASPEVGTRASWREFLLRLFREANFDRNYRNFLIVRFLTGIGFMPFGFLAVYATQKFDLPSSAAAFYTMIMMGAVVVTGVFWGRLGERVGYRLLFIAGLSFWMGGILWALLAPSAHWFGLTFFVVGMAQVTDFIGSINIMLESCPRLEKGGFVAISSLLVAPGVGIGPVLGGVIAQAFSYELMFLVGVALLGVCWLILAFLFKEPRRLRLPS